MSHVVSSQFCAYYKLSCPPGCALWSQGITSVQDQVHHVSLSRTEHAIPHNAPNETVCCMACHQPLNSHMSFHKTQHTVHGQSSVYVYVVFVYFFVLLSPVLFAMLLLCAVVMVHYFASVLLHHQVHQCPSHHLLMEPVDNQNNYYICTKEHFYLDMLIT